MTFKSLTDSNGSATTQLVLFVLIFALVAIIGYSLRNTAYYPLVVIDTPDQLQLTFLQKSVNDNKACMTASASVASLVMANCATCKITHQGCLRSLSEEQHTLLSDEPVSMPTARIANGIIAYAHPDPRVSLTTCLASAQLRTPDGRSSQVVCHHAGMPRPFPEAQRRVTEEISLGLRALAITIGGLLVGIALVSIRALITNRRSINVTDLSKDAIAPGTLVPYSIWPGKLTLAATDALVLLSTFAVLAWPDPGNTGFLSKTESDAIFAHAMLALITIAWFWLSLEHYARRRPFWDELREVYRVLALMFMCAGATVFIASLDTSRNTFLWVWAFNFALLPLGRAVAKALLDQLGAWQQPAIIIGTGENAQQACFAVQNELNMGYRILAFISHGDCAEAGNKNIQTIDSRIPTLKAEQDICRQIELLGNPRVIIALESLADQTNQQLARKLAASNASIHVIPSLRGLPLFGTELSHFLGHELLFMTVRNNLARRSYQWLKRGFDIVASLLLLILLSPLFAFVALIIRKSGGSAFYSHTRIGRHGKPFQCLKFRSMRPDADKILGALLASDPAARAEWEKDFKLRNDPRITPIGQFLRKTSLDELPQLINVLKGEMSLVGPRPIVQEELERYAESVQFYLEARPGITGLWQVSGRNDTGYARRVSLDSWYVQNWSLWYDIAILFKTINILINRRGAY